MCVCSPVLSVFRVLQLNQSKQKENVIMITQDAKESDVRKSTANL